MIQLVRFPSMKKKFSAFIASIQGLGALVCLSISALILTACAGLDGSTKVSEAKAETEFNTTVKPLFEHRCVWCHNDRDPKAGLNLQNRDIVFNSTSSFVVPGSPEKSSLYTAIGRHPQHLKAMPADGWKITTKQAEAIRNWIAGGAPWPEGSAGEIQKKNYRVDLDDYL